MRAAVRAAASLLLLLSSAGAHHAYSCPPGNWQHHGHSCYYMSTAQLTWTDALSTCRSLGGDLVSIADADENAFVANILNLTGRAWIGYNDRAQENHYVWTDGLQSGYSNWRDGERNGGTRENCVDIAGNPDDYGTWGDWLCSGDGKVHHFVCKMAELPASPLDGICTLCDQH